MVFSAVFVFSKYLQQFRLTPDCLCSLGAERGDDLGGWGGVDILGVVHVCSCVCSIFD